MGVSVPLLILLQGWVGVGTVSPLTPVFCNVCVYGGGGGGIYTTVGWGFLWPIFTTGGGGGGGYTMVGEGFLCPTFTGGGGEGGVPIYTTIGGGVLYPHFHWGVGVGRRIYTTVGGVCVCVPLSLLLREEGGSMCHFHYWAIYTIVGGGVLCPTFTTAGVLCPHCRMEVPAFPLTLLWGSLGSVFWWPHLHYWRVELPVSPHSDLHYCRGWGQKGGVEGLQLDTRFVLLNSKIHTPCWVPWCCKSLSLSEYYGLICSCLLH